MPNIMRLFSFTLNNGFLNKKFVRTDISTLLRNYGSKSATNTVTATLSNGRSLTIAAGELARFADGTATVTMGDTTVLVTAVSKQKSNSSFMPLTVDFRQKSAAAGRIPTNFLRRELGPSEKEILTARLIDRSLRPLFPNEFKCETQLVCNMLAIDSMHLPDVLAINAASTALSLSDIPWNGPVAAVRIGMVGDEILINPTRRELKSSELDLVVSATKQHLIVMLEGKGNVILLPKLQKAIKQGAKDAQTIIQAIEKLQRSNGKTKREIDPEKVCSGEVSDAVRAMSEMRLREIFRNSEHDKLSRDHAVAEIRKSVVESVWSSFPDVEPSLIQESFNKCCKMTFRDLIFEDERRCDGRTFDELRNISCKINMHKPLHGSALFQRGQTQVFCTVSLDSVESAMKLDHLTAVDTGVKSKNFFLHYEFPPYATGEIGKSGPIGRREIGHGALAEKGLLATIPNDFPFTVRLTSEVLESNGSSSMASVCGGSLALMDAGVPLSAAAAGVAIGLVTRYEDNELQDYRILTDILGIEDYMGDMDMKVAGTEKGFTAIQADIKVPGISLKVVMEALQKSHNAKTKILGIMNECIATPRKVRKECWPVTEDVTVEPHQRPKLIGQGGTNIKKIYLQTGAQLTQNDENSFTIFAPSESSMAEVKEVIETLLKADKEPDLEFGAIYTAKIVEIKDIGVMVTLFPSMTPTLLHNSQLDQRKVAHPSAIGLQVKDEIQVKYFGRDPVSGFMRLSRKVLQGPTSSVIKNLDKSSVG
ncbi:polyribonucleotide nucleotidyltransferase 1, mitochondrial [Bradysia coprophila]|uniref:polyribonucleotide nucleotidyltransferase 1, mitochondrial n=1 Tax=Bradysia coprophila TaxID=38358 RepID=UPI00187D8848|nr:polyribonucleotide nucleotidyltransferase 1, mitochondrial [Bradysia coprophila]